MKNPVLLILLGVIWLHFIADFLLQNDKMAINKSSSNKWLTLHSVLYSLPFLSFGLKSFALIFITHWIVDYFSSRATTKLWLKNERHWFFVAIGLDQAVHLTLLVVILGVK